MTHWGIDAEYFGVQIGEIEGSTQADSTLTFRGVSLPWMRGSPRIPQPRIFGCADSYYADSPLQDYRRGLRERAAGEARGTGRGPPL